MDLMFYRLLDRNVCSDTIMELVFECELLDLIFFVLYWVLLGSCVLLISVLGLLLSFCSSFWGMLVYFFLV